MIGIIAASVPCLKSMFHRWFNLTNSTAEAIQDRIRLKRRVKGQDKQTSFPNSLASEDFDSTCNTIWDGGLPNVRRYEVHITGPGE